MSSNYKHGRFVCENRKEEILKLSETLLPPEVGRRIGVSGGSISRFLRRRGISPRDGRLFKNPQLNQTFFANIDTEEKAYWLGFLYADGYVFNQKKVHFDLNLAARDGGHLVKFQAAIASKHKISVVHHLSTNKSGEKVKHESRILSISSKQIVADLIQKGCYQKKSLTLIFPREDQVPVSLRNHFIRGYFDGDGFIQQTVRDNYAIGFIGTKEFCEGIISYLGDNGVVCNALHRDKGCEKNIFRVKICNRKGIYMFYNLIFQGANVFLDRKMEMFQLFLKTHFEPKNRTDIVHSL